MTRSASVVPEASPRVFGLDRRDLTKHAKRCLVGERRRRVEADLQKMAAGAEGGG